MTKEAKKARRELRHRMQAAARERLSSAKRMGMFARNAQLDAAAKVLTDRALSHQPNA